MNNLEFVPSDEQVKAFKDWVQSQDSKPHVWDASRWFQISQCIDNVSEASLNSILSPLVDEAIEDAIKDVEERNKVLTHLKVPGFGLPLGYMPPRGMRFPVLIGVHSYDWKAATLVIREVCMLKYIEELTNKSRWWEKVFNPEIANKWKQEALQMNWEEYRPHADFTPTMADACIHELCNKADLLKKTGLITIFDYSSCVIKSDILIPESLRNALRLAVAKLENVPDEEKDWHPGSTRKVLDLVHPSLWPFIYGRTPVLLDKRINLGNALSHCGVGTVLPAPKPIEIAGPESDWSRPMEKPFPSLSYKFQWLPCDIILDGQSAKIDSYINNLHPVDHANLYPIIERFIEKALPAWDVIYRWPIEFETQRLKTREARSECTTKEICQENYGCYPWNRPVDEGELWRNDNEPYTEEYRSSERFKRDMAWLVETHKLNLPEPVVNSDDYLRLKASDVKSSGFFNSAPRIQVIVKLANVQLTPDDPEFKFEVSEELADWYTNPINKDENDLDLEGSSYKPNTSEASPSWSEASSSGCRALSLDLPDYQSIYVDNDPTEFEGGSWHTEGMLNERICATALFYYDSENVTDCHLDFRTPADREKLVVNLNYEQSQHFPIERTFAIPNTDRDTLQYVGGVLTTNSPSTQDTGTRAVFFPNLLQHRVSPFRLKDPTKPGHRKILALFLVDPAIPILSTANVPPQQRHWWSRETGIEEALAQRLPSELMESILDDTAGLPIGIDEAKTIRLNLMEERSMKQDNTEEELRRAGWNFCEH
ncbi:wd40 repeat 2 [Trichoderma arundinaceum]|uniref:Wd40 repeat 2 n=1 Tax=Trichoderma arundinaceum TaxID=490622 RepID=A0A395NBU5_TRIAR|nr:wd40 repeat 2 [Trichoderma arundinaceum]